MNLKEQREKIGMSRAELCRRLGVSASVVVGVEAGAFPMAARHVAEWAAAIQAPFDEVARHVGGEVKLFGLSPAERARVSNLVGELKAGRAA